MSLHDIQKAVQVAKDKRNDFGGYNYRNAEQILAAVKPHLPEGWAVICTDDIVPIGEVPFLRAKAVLLDNQREEVASACGWAMHAMQKKGMDPAQITGACSSYARKYALQGLFALDDGSVDPDATNRHEEKGSSPQTEALQEAFLDAALNDLSDAERDDPHEVGKAYARALGEKGKSYKSAAGLTNFFTRYREAFDFASVNAPEHYQSMIDDLREHRKALEAK